MNKLNRKELRLKIEDLYFKSLGVDDSKYIPVLDAIKSFEKRGADCIEIELPHNSY